jgi:hypothetical protein
MKRIGLLLLAVAAPLALGNSYYVPVPSELNEFKGTHGIQARATLAKGTLDVEYSLPTWLVGTKLAPLRFTGQVTQGSSFVNVGGKSVGGTCMLSGAAPVTCLLRYPRNIVDLATRNLELERLFSGNDLLMRQQVAALFGDSPAGVLTVTLD